MWTVTVNVRVFFCWHDLTVTVSLPSTLHGPPVWTTEHVQTLPSMGCFCSLPTMLITPLRPPITTYWTTADRAFFIDREKVGLINIDDTTPAAVDVIQNKYWMHKSIRSFCNNYRKIASDLQVERNVHGGRGTHMSSVLLHDHTPLSLIFPLS